MKYYRVDTLVCWYWRPAGWWSSRAKAQRFVDAQARLPCRIVPDSLPPRSAV